ncbi:hypothetical protein [Citrobacter sp. RHB25-C09]|uniref:hypothetical protein n=1 Tax=Citrobacter sp. RHB25-C09 TaxID=2742624 RepID=UPI0015EF9F9F|nr:hypothetical protein [Citrobacter sp. RHB25-C09]QMI06459.1 hypothetical protein HVY19_17040 [Citrobacter sp. RHB25-C09]
MSYYEEETRALSAVLLAIYTAQHEAAFCELESALRQLAFPPAIRRLCEEALQSRFTDKAQPSDAKAVACLLQALESISGYKHIERYITQRNLATVYS